MSEKTETLAYNPDDWKDEPRLVHYGCGIVDKDGNAFETLSTDRDDVNGKVIYLNNSGLYKYGIPFKSVELFYKEEGE